MFICVQLQYMITLYNVIVLSIEHEHCLFAFIVVIYCILASTIFDEKQCKKGKVTLLILIAPNDTTFRETSLTLNPHFIVSVMQVAVVDVNLVNTIFVLDTCTKHQCSSEKCYLSQIMKCWHAYISIIYISMYLLFSFLLLFNKTVRIQEMSKSYCVYLISPLNS